MRWNLTLRPISGWPWAETRHRARSPFSAAWMDTMKLLDRELSLLHARQLVLEADFQEDDLRVTDGWPKASANQASPRVILNFQSKHGPLRYPCDRFTDWQANVRAIALGLEALRRVDRYGITARGEQYTGWKALPASAGPTLTTELAADVIAGYSGDVRGHLMASPERCKSAIRDALRASHPDHGGGADHFDLVQKARAVLATHHGVSL